MKKLILLMSLFVYSGVYAGGKEITGAFGIKLGQKANPEGAKKQVEMRDKRVFYYFTPKVKMPDFEHYMLTITPKTKKIAEIRIMADCADEAAAVELRDSLVTKLEESYGARETAGNLANFAKVRKGFVITKGKRYIMLTINAQNQLVVSYIDGALKDKAKHELREKLKEDMINNE